MSSLGLLEAKIIPTLGNFCHGCYFCGFGSNLVVGGGLLVVGGGSFAGSLGGLCMCVCDGFQKSYADLTP